MALEHAILVSLAERSATGYDLARRFDASIGNFWKASHQQIYKVLGRMHADGLVTSEAVAQDGRGQLGAVRGFRRCDRGHGRRLHKLGRVRCGVWDVDSLQTEGLVDRIGQPCGVFVLGGGVSNLPGLAETIQPMLAERVFGGECVTPVRLAKHGDSSGVRGAAWL